MNTEVYGYKLLENDWTAGGRYYKVGETYTSYTQGWNPFIKSSYFDTGIPFYTELADCLKYLTDYNFRVVRVKAMGSVISVEEEYNSRLDSSESDLSDEDDVDLNSLCTTDEIQIISEVNLQAENLQEYLIQHGITMQLTKQSIKSYSLNTIKKLLSISPSLISLIDNPTEELQLELVKKNGSIIQYIENPSEEVQLEAVKQDGDVIGRIRNPSIKVAIAHVDLIT